MIPFETERLIVRRWEEADRAAFHRLNSDETVMRFFPFRRSRAESDAVMDRFNAMLDRDGITFFALESLADGEIVGMTGMAWLDPNMPFPPGVEIGWRLLPEHVGKGYATEAATACLDQAFAGIGLDEIVSFCVETNAASEAVMLRLGFHRGADFDHPNVDPVAHPGLVRHRAYHLARNEWRARPAAD